MVSKKELMLYKTTGLNPLLKLFLTEKIIVNTLKSLCRKNDINVPIGPAFTDSPKQVNTKDLNPQSTGPIIYRGQERTKEWFEKMYNVYKDEIVYIDGKYQHKGDMKFNPIFATPAEVNSVIDYVAYGERSSVIQVIGPGEA